MTVRRSSSGKVRHGVLGSQTWDSGCRQSSNSLNVLSRLSNPSYKAIRRSYSPGASDPLRRVQIFLQDLNTYPWVSAALGQELVGNRVDDFIIDPIADLCCHQPIVTVLGPLRSTWILVS